MFGAQDILMGHGGEFQADFFTYGKNLETDYKSRLLAISKYAYKRTQVLEDMIKDYPPELQPVLRNKLAKTVLTMRDEHFQAEREALSELPKMQGQITEIEKRQDSYREENKNYEKEEKEASDNLNKIRKEIKGLEQEENTAKQKTEMIKTQYDIAEQELKELTSKKNKKKSSKEKIEVSQSAVNTLQAQYEQAKSEMWKAQDALKKAKDEEYSLEKKVLDAGENIRENKNRIAKLDEEIKSITKEIQNFNLGEKNAYSFKEQRVNEEEYGVQNLEQLKMMLHSFIGKDGKQSEELFETSQLYVERKNLIASYQDGLLAPLVDRIMEVPEFLVDILDSAETVAMKRIEEIYIRFAPLGEAINMQKYSFVGEFFLADGFADYLDENKNEYKEYEKVVNEGNPDKMVKFWNQRLEEFTGSYLTQSKQNTKSIMSNLEQGTGSAEKLLVGHFKDEESDSWFDKVEEKEKEERKEIKAQFKSTKFKIANVLTCGLVNLLDNTSDTYMRADRKAIGLIKQLNDHLMGNSDTLQAANIQGTLEAYYEKHAKNYMANDPAAQEAFLKYVLSHQTEELGELGEVLSQGFESDVDLKKTIGAMSYEDQKKLMPP